MENGQISAVENSAGKRKFFFPRKKIFSYSAFQTKKLGKDTAKEILKTGPGKKALILALKGNLGSGKTTFLQGFAKGLGIKEKVLSPSFIIMRKYKIQNTRYKIQNFYHIDCYRLKKAKEIIVLGFKEIISEPKNIVAIEWAEKIAKIIPSAAWLNFKFMNKNIREISPTKQYGR